MRRRRLGLLTVLPLLAAVAAGAAAADAVGAAPAGSPGGGDSLKSALDAISRRQRDLAAALSGGAGSALAPLHLSGKPHLAYLASPADFAGDGQPENIGYGYQKSGGGGGGGGGVSGPAAGMGVVGPGEADGLPPGVGGRALERLLLEYLEGAPGRPSLDKRASVFRERASLYAPMRPALRKRRLQPSPFRERTALQALQALQAHKREAQRQAAEALAERERAREEAEEEEEEEEEAEEEEREHRQRQQEEEGEEEYLSLLQDLWRKYRQGSPGPRRLEDLDADDLQELLAEVADGNELEDELGLRAPDKRQYGGFDYFNNGGAMGGWAPGGMYRKRGSQRLDEPQGGAGFLYALKFASPAAQRDALEALADAAADGPDAAGERDHDAARLAAAAALAATLPVGTGGRQLGAVEEVFGPGGGADDEEEYQRLAGPSMRKRGRVPYDGIPLRKRYPVSKRSPSAFASPPLMHRRSGDMQAAAHEHEREHEHERRRKKDADEDAPPDPKVANELTQIFGSELHASASAGSAATTPAPSSPSGGVAPPAASPAPSAAASAPLATDAVAAAAGTAAPTAPADPTRRNGSRELTPDEQRASSHGDPEREQPAPSQSVREPLEVFKKSVDWSQYFGLDRRRKKTGAWPARPGLQAPQDLQALQERWLLERARGLALAGAVRRRGRRGGAESDEGEGVDGQLRGAEEQIVNEALKFTGAHQGASDPAELQEVKDRILARLAAAYNLEKMRLALREFKSSLQAQRASQYNPENQENEEDKKKRVAVKKEKAEEKEGDQPEEEGEPEEEEEDKKKRVAAKKANAGAQDEDAPEFLETPRGIEPLSEGYMGSAHPNDIAAGVAGAAVRPCPSLWASARECGRALGSALLSAFDQETYWDDGARAHALLLPQCARRGACHVCASGLPPPAAAACDAAFVREAARVCDGDPRCDLAARRALTMLPPPPPQPRHCRPAACLVPPQHARAPMPLSP